MEVEERNKLVIDNMKLVHYLASKMYCSPYAYYDYEDIAQEGMIGLIKAAEYYKPELGFKFSTYASGMINGYMMRFIRENQQSLKFSRSDIDAYVKIMRSGKEISEITSADLEELEITQHQFSAVVSMVGVVSLESPTNEDESLMLLDKIPAITDDLSDEFYEDELEKIKDKVLDRKKVSDKVRDICDEWFYSCLLGIKAQRTYLGYKYGFSQSYITRIIQNFRSEMLKELSKSGYDVKDYEE